MGKYIIFTILELPMLIAHSGVTNNQRHSLRALLESEQEIFFYHGDHLGSANWITDANGLPVQYIHYGTYKSSLYR